MGIHIHGPLILETRHKRAGGMFGMMEEKGGQGGGYFLGMEGNVHGKEFAGKGCKGLYDGRDFFTKEDEFGVKGFKEEIDHVDRCGRRGKPGIDLLKNSAPGQKFLIDDHPCSEKDLGVFRIKGDIGVAGFMESGKEDIKIRE